MKLSFIESVKKQLSPKVSKRVDFRSIKMSASEAPKIVEKENYDYVWYGEHNLYPDQLYDLKYGSSIHNSILKTKAKMMAGDGLLFNGAKTKEESEQVYQGLQGQSRAEVDFLLANKNGGMPLEKVQDFLSNDYQDYGAYAYKLLFNSDFTKIAGIKPVSVANLRSGKMNKEGEIEKYYFHRDWKKFKTGYFEPTPIVAHHENNKEAYEQLVYRKAGNAEYYGVAPYAGCINWIHIDFQMGIFHKKNIENGMNPGLHFKFYKLPSSEEQMDEIMDSIKSEWQGALNTGKPVITFNDSKDGSMDIVPVEVSGLDKQLVHLSELCDNKILTGHQLTTPLLAGVSVPGKMGGDSQLEIGYQIFDGLTMAADRKVLRDDVKMWFDYNKTGVTVELNKFKPFQDQPKAQTVATPVNPQQNG